MVACPTRVRRPTMNMFRLLIAALCVSSAAAYGTAAPTKGMQVFTGSKDGHIYRTAAPAQPKQMRSEMVYMSGTEEVVQYEMFDPIKTVVQTLPFLVLLAKFGGIF